MVSQNKTVVLMLFLLIPFFSRGQKNDSLFYHKNSYRLDLPKQWNRHKLIEAITEILPQTIDELKDRDFCTEGKAAYSVWLYLDSLSVYDVQTSPPVEIGSIPHYTFSFNYNFYAALMITDSLKKTVSSLQIISNEEIMTYTKQFSMLPQNVVYRYVTIYDNRGRAVGRRLVEEAGAVNMYVPKFSPFSILTQDFLLNICEKKILEIRRMLKKINPD
ncbi:MAG: hypothetical protein ACRDEB_08495 [Chitinophagaceae bacterium]